MEMLVSGLLPEELKRSVVTDQNLEVFALHRGLRELSDDSIVRHRGLLSLRCLNFPVFVVLRDLNGVNFSEGGVEKFKVNLGPLERMNPDTNSRILGDKIMNTLGLGQRHDDGNTMKRNESK